jgi:hypothetical protein
MSRDHALATVDRRTRAGRVLRTVEADLVDHLGGHPSAAEMLIIRSAAIKATRLALLSEKLLSGEDLSDHANDHALAWLNSMRLDLSALGLNRRVKDVSPSLGDILASHKGAAG